MLSMTFQMNRQGGSILTSLWIILKKAHLIILLQLVIKNAAGEEVVNTSMPAIDGIDSGLKQIRLIARSAQPYFANMTVETKPAGDVIVNGYQKIAAGTGSVTLKNNTDEPEVCSGVCRSV